MKIVSLFAQTSFYFLVLLPFARPSQAHSDVMIDDGYKVQMSHKLLCEITIHGFLMWLSMGLLIPIGILTMRMSNIEECGKRPKTLFLIHAITQTLGVIVATSGALMSFKNFSNSFDNNHQRIGVALYGLIWLQAITGFFRPPRGSQRRGSWYIIHWILGTAVSLIGVFSIYSGLFAYRDKTSGNITFWLSLFTAQLLLFCFIFLLQEKWTYIQSQSCNTTTDLNTLLKLRSQKDEIAA